MPDPEFDPRRAARATTMIHSNDRYRSSIDNIGDVLLDIMHYAIQNGKDFGSELKWAEKAMAEDQEVIRHRGD